MRAEKISFEKYLESMIGIEKAKEILKMTDDEKANSCIIISGRQGPTGKSTLARVLHEHGYNVLEPYEYINITLDQPLEEMIPNYASFVEGEKQNAVI